MVEGVGGLARSFASLYTYGTPRLLPCCPNNDVTVYILQGNSVYFRRVLYNEERLGESFEVKIGATPMNTTKGISDVKSFTPKVYDVYLGEEIRTIDLRVGGVYTLVVSKNVTETVMSLLEVTPPNNVHMLWLIPQYVVITAGEVMFSITGLEFSYSQAPVSMKALVQAGWLLTVAFGNLIVVIIAEAKFFHRQLFEFILFAVLMLVDMFLFALMAMCYKYHSPQLDDD